MNSSAQLRHPIPDPLVEVIAERFRVLSEPMRIRLLDHLRESEATVGELVDATGTSQQNVSKHLKVLLQAGFVGRTRDGNYSRYRIVDESVFRICEEVCGAARERVAQLERLFEEGSA